MLRLKEGNTSRHRKVGEHGCRVGSDIFEKVAKSRDTQTKYHLRQVVRSRNRSDPASARRVLRRAGTAREHPQI